MKEFDSRERRCFNITGSRFSETVFQQSERR